MVWTIRVSSNSDTDQKGSELLAEINRNFNTTSIKKIRTAKVYRLEGITKKEFEKLKDAVLYESIDQVASTKPLFPNAQRTIEIAYKPGVMNPEVASIIKCAKDLGINLEAADSSWEFSFFGKIEEPLLREITNKLLLNKTIQKVVTTPPKTLKISGSQLTTKIIPIRQLSDKKLMDLSKDKLFLNLEEMKIIQNYFKKINRDPTDCEVEILAQTWSEHCVHKTFRAKLEIDGVVKEPFIRRIKSTIKNNPKIVVSAFEDNSGVIDFFDEFAINGKVETHNSPSAIEPYGGSMTGSGGVFRDILGTGQGAKPIISTDIFCFAPPTLKDSDVPPGCLTPTYILRQVVAGVRDYGNRVGIPTNNGSIHFDPDFRAKPTVAVGSFGILPKKYAIKRNPRPGDLIVTAGGATGRDGIHGATFSSGEMSAKTQEVSGSAVQIGNAIEEKRMIDAILKLRDQNLIRAITDCGAGGFSSAIGEMAKECGAEVNLENVHIKYVGLAPWEIFLSESQERMILAIDSKKIKEAQEIFKLFNVPSTVIGKFTNNKRLKVLYKKEVVANLDMHFLHEGLPQRFMIGKTAKNKIKNNQPNKPQNFQKLVEKVLSNPNVCSKEPILRQYDHNVQGTTALHPLGGVHFDSPNDGAIVTPILGKPYGLVVSHGLNPVLNRIDPYSGSIWSLTEAVSNFVAIGGNIKDAALVDNFIWPFPDEESLADLDKSVDACVDFSRIVKMPFISGKDSLSSTYRYPNGELLKIPPVLLISVFGKIANIKNTASSDFKKTNSTIVLVGEPDFNNLAGSIYFNVTKATSPNTPQINLKTLPKVLNSITKSIKSGKALSVHDISEGGFISALSEMCFGGDIGADINLSKLSKKAREDFILFNETSGTFLVEVEDEKTAKELFKNIPHFIIGRTLNKKTINIKFQNSKISLSLDQLKNAWLKPMGTVFHAS